MTGALLRAGMGGGEACGRHIERCQARDDEDDERDDGCKEPGRLAESHVSSISEPRAPWHGRARRSATAAAPAVHLATLGMSAAAGGCGERETDAPVQLKTPDIAAALTSTVGGANLGAVSMPGEHLESQPARPQACHGGVRDGEVG